MATNIEQMFRSFCCFAFLPTYLLLAAPTATAQTSKPVAPGPPAVQPEPEPVLLYKAWRPVEYGLTAAALTFHLTKDLYLKEHTEVRWRSPILVDEQLRASLRGATEQRRERIRTASDVLLWGLQLYPFVVDAGLIAGAVRRSPYSALQLSLIDLQAFALTGLVTTTTKRLVGRSRPYTEDCDVPLGEPGCQADGPNQSFISGHAAVAFTGAGLMCFHYIELRLVRNRKLAGVLCGMGLAAASATAALRVAGDRHHASDVLASSLVGVLSGYLLPTLLHAFPWRSKPDQGGRR